MFQKIKNILSLEMIWKKILAYGLLIFFFYITKDFLFLFLLTFLFAYLTYVFAKFIIKILKKYIKKENKFTKILLNINCITSFLYIWYIFWFIFFISHLVPLLINELNNLSHHIPMIWDYIKSITSSLHQIQSTQKVVSEDLTKIMNEKNIWIVMNSIQHIKAFWWELIKFFLAFVLSYFFIIDRKKLHKYLEWIKSSSVGFLYNEYDFLFWKVAKWFLLIFKAQSKIALVNATLTFIWLYIIWLIFWHSIPYIWILTFMVFLFSFIPVLWAILSSIPIALIIYNIDWFHGVLAVILMVSIIHIIEAYILNPRFVSEEVELPISLTFLILLIWEHLFGAIWLIVSVPLFYITIEILKDIDLWIKKEI